MNIYDQLQAVEDRYEELGELLSDPDVACRTILAFLALLKKILRLPLWHGTKTTVILSFSSQFLSSGAAYVPIAL